MDYVIVGGGIYGCGVAWELARRGAEVLLLEARSIAAGASGGAGKRGVRANGRDLRELPLMKLAYDIWPDLHMDLGAPTGYEQVGHLMLIERERDLVAAPARAWAQRQKGIPTRIVDREALATLEPLLSPAIKAALFCPQDGVADHAATTLAYAAAARRAGATIRQQTCVTGIERQGGRVSAVVTESGKRIAVRRGLFLLANSHVPPLLKEQFALTLPVWSRLPQILITSPVDPPPVRHLIGHAHRRLAMKPGPRQTVMISGGWLGERLPNCEAGTTVRGQIEANLAEATAVYPSLTDIPIRYAAAARPESNTFDNIPIIDRVPGCENALFATGWSGHGWAIAPAVVRLLCEWVLRKQRPPLLRPFEYGRFMSYTQP